MKNMLNKINLIIKNPNVLWSMIGITANSFYSLILMFIVSRVNGIEQSGVFAFAFYMSTIFQTIGNYGGRIYQVSDANQMFEESTYVSLKYVSATIMILTTFVFCLLNGYEIFKLSLILTFVGYRYFENIAEAYFGILQKNNRLDLAGKSTAMKAIFSSILFIIINITTKNMLLASMSFVVVYVLVLYFYDCKNASQFGKITITFNQNIIILAKRSFQVFLYNFLNILILNITRYFIDLRMSDTIQGYYSYLVMPASLISLCAHFLVQPMVTTLVEEYNKNNMKQFARNCTLMLLALITVGVLGAFVAYFILTDILGVIYNVSLTEYRLESSLLLLAGICSGGTTIISTILVIMRKLTHQTIAYISSAVCVTVIAMIMVNSSLSMAIYAYILGLGTQFIIFVILFIVLLKKQLHNWQLKNLEER